MKIKSIVCAIVVAFSSLTGFTAHAEDEVFDQIDCKFSLTSHISVYSPNGYGNPTYEGELPIYCDTYIDSTGSIHFKYVAADNFYYDDAESFDVLFDNDNDTTQCKLNVVYPEWVYSGNYYCKETFSYYTRNRVERWDSNMYSDDNYLENLSNPSYTSYLKWKFRVRNVSEIHKNDVLYEDTIKIICPQVFFDENGKPYIKTKLSADAEPTDVSVYDNNMLYFTVNGMTFTKTIGEEYSSLVDLFTFGDINRDGMSNVADVILLQKWLLTAVTDLPSWRAADMNCDNRLDVFDLCLLKRRLIYGADV